jgi:hypothetical protein
MIVPKSEGRRATIPTIPGIEENKIAKPSHGCCRDMSCQTSSYLTHLEVSLAKGRNIWSSFKRERVNPGKSRTVTLMLLLLSPDGKGEVTYVHQAHIIPNQLFYCHTYKKW